MRAHVGFTLLASALLAACTSVIGVDDWVDPLADAGAGGASTGHGPASVTIGAGGYPACDACASTNCGDASDACSADAQCATFQSCLGDLPDCCQAGGQGAADPASQALFDCLAASCLVECVINATCADCFLNGLESDVDCGGDSCAPCALGKHCNGDADCASHRCGEDKRCF